jgi:CubicO group peptidase (beta-lactamase class C family)
VLVDESFGHDGSPVYIASAGKSLTSLAIGRLLATGALDSLDQPVSSLFPEWRQGRKRTITVRQLLNHTSGMQNHPNASVELEPPPNWRVPDVVRLALAAELSDEPGSTARYNNKAVALLGGIIERASGRRMDTYFEEEFFRPMGITRYDWIRDEAGQPTAHGAFLLTARDLARFGELMRNGGVLDGRHYFHAEWVDSSFARSQPHEPRWGMLWWRLPEWTHFTVRGGTLDTLRAAGVSADFLAAAEPLRDSTFASRDAYWEALRAMLGDQWRTVLNEALAPVEFGLATMTHSDRIAAYHADGFRGNYLVVVPDAGLVAVRVKGRERFDPEHDTFPDFVRRIADLAEQCR